MLRRFTAKLPARQVMIEQVPDRTAAAPLSVREGAEHIDLGLGQEQGHRQGAAQGPCARAEPGAARYLLGYYSPPAIPADQPHHRDAALVSGGGTASTSSRSVAWRKYTLASNASRDPELLVALKEARERTPKVPEGPDAG